ncbi:MAG TPA: hypothetical protein VFR81_07680 [Longimicrobium sp.]|nr:hypothetical protein [Longimicrobium sp.]
MKSARILLACAAVSVLAACSADPVAPTRDDTDGIAPPSTRSNNTATCAGTIKIVTNADGSLSYECVVESKQTGSGG